MSKNPYRDFGFGGNFKQKGAESKNSGDKSKTVVNFKNGGLRLDNLDRLRLGFDDAFLVVEKSSPCSDFLFFF
ncbi:hypothetical protein MTR_8g045935 [Medicago truncatula]|uniref:Uncharacterized protein n=1 Tax=Medicago truncatula TaxID=3880 RepID=A0A072TPE9_MEDTR|nr:hypothetical protein MTR_8g045935 [Medicago truncatula]